MVHSSQTTKKVRSPAESAKTDAARAPKTKDWSTENAAFVAAYNELIDTEGVALEEYRLF